MIEDVAIFNAKEASVYNLLVKNPGKNVGLIRIASPGLLDTDECSPIKYKDNFSWIRKYEFDDVLPHNLSEFPHAKLFSKKQFEEILSNFKEDLNYTDVLTIHCRADISRSSAIALSLWQIFFKDDLPLNNFFFPKRQYPNEYVFSTMINQGEKFR